jgi:hypothetical protein
MKKLSQPIFDPSKLLLGSCDNSDYCSFLSIFEVKVCPSPISSVIDRDLDSLLLNDEVWQTNRRLSLTFLQSVALLVLYALRNDLGHASSKTSKR